VADGSKPAPRETGQIWVWVVISGEVQIGAVIVKAANYSAAEDAFTQIITPFIPVGGSLSCRYTGPFPAWFIDPEYRDRLVKPEEANGIPLPI
jgi:hypothetical protein